MLVRDINKPVTKYSYEEDELQISPVSHAVGRMKVKKRKIIFSLKPHSMNSNLD